MVYGKITAYPSTIEKLPGGVAIVFEKTFFL
jgi:hypothetical protein